MFAAILPSIFALIDKIIPNKGEADKRKSEINMLVAKGEIDLAIKEMDLLIGQMEINKAEANHSSMFVAGWRPACGWLCVIALSAKYVFLPLAVFILSFFNINYTIPTLETGELLTLLFALLGVAGLRTLEKSKGVAREVL